MLDQLRRHLTYANVVSTLCLFVLLGGTAYAATALSRNSVRGKHIAKNAITSSKVKNRSLRARDFALGQLPRGEKGDPGVVNIEVRRVDVALPPGPGGGSPGEIARTLVGCAVDQRIIGGAAYVINSNGEVRSSRPASDDVGAGGTPENGGTFRFWAASGQNNTTAPVDMRVFAFCAQLP